MPKGKGHKPMDPAIIEERKQRAVNRYRRPCQKFLPELKLKFVEVLADQGTFRAAAEAVGIDPNTARNARDLDPEFDQACEAALTDFADRLEGEASRRAVDGWERPLYYQGAQVGAERLYSDRLLELQLKAHRPEKYREKFELGGPGGGPLQIKIQDFSPGADGRSAEVIEAEVVTDGETKEKVHLQGDQETRRAIPSAGDPPQEKHSDGLAEPDREGRNGGQGHDSGRTDNRDSAPDPESSAGTDPEADVDA
jgi:hypothetical protein